MVTACVQLAAHTNHKTKDSIWLHVQLRQRETEVGFLVVTNLETDTILRSAYIDKNFENRCIPVAMERC